MTKKRFEHELPQSIITWGWKYHHLGIPTNNVMPNERYLPQYKFYVSEFDESPFGIEWMRFDKDCTIHELIKTVPHLAFVVKDLDFELTTRKFKILSEPGLAMAGIRVAMIEYNGAPIELMEIEHE